ncbi:MAG TPA: hypothetical protein VKQ72_17200 [Aggregatilineales bacterium]|nr:hypothetical protein [Aggregatilineales bacterium]
MPYVSVLYYYGLTILALSNIDFFAPSDVPQPPDKIVVEKLEAKPYPDGWRVRVSVDVTPFQQRPNLEIQVRSAEGRVVSELSVIETMIRHMEFTMHLRGLASPRGSYMLTASLYYGEDPSQSQHRSETPFEIEGA